MTAQSLEHNLIILPDGQAKAFNRNFKQQVCGGGPLHAMLNNLAARLQQGKTTIAEAWGELRKIVDAQGMDTHERWLIGELDGVRVYINGTNYIMTKRDLYK